MTSLRLKALRISAAAHSRIAEAVAGGRAELAATVQAVEIGVARAAREPVVAAEPAEAPVRVATRMAMVAMVAMESVLDALERVNPSRIEESAFPRP